ncbi:hypothetical protein EYR40_002157 [Pleurotus pulmonarius]|nr:hypothetical protein EYR36_011437 [Pleurotus pulmonarius]KAF4585320.1 hypothetical protein EYR40_002157 [Pleurotus pulmonarius]KAF4607660.1 hypothetical protein EYR38_001733 [Pleurotus pulmonarius]
MADITPRSPAAHDFISGLYTSATMHSVVREELAGKVSEDDSAVFKRLEIDQQQLCNLIADFSYPVELKATRNIKIAAGRQLKGEEYTTGFPKVTPDGTGSRVLECDSWKDTDWFVAIKPAESQGLAAEDAPISEVVCQAADYARLHVSCRPFQLFSVGLLIFGRKFMVGFFDRDGVSLSPASDFCDAGEGFRTFIRVIRRLVSPRLSDIELGSDPTAQPLSPSSDLHAAARELAISRGLPPDFPPYVVLCPREYSKMVRGVTSTTWEQNAWLTVGPPIWVSLSLIGRGTNIWPVVPLVSNSGKYAIVDGAPLSILKNAWRNSERTGEASIYGSLNAPPPGVARFLQGGDVRFDSETDIPISVHNLRRQYPYGAWLHRVATNAASSVPPGTGTGTGTAVLHRLILQTIGRPLWQFASYLELLKAFRAAIVGHQRLIAQGILHRDISAGNIMISANDNPGVGEEGFLMDLEFARIDEVVHDIKVPGGPQHTTWSAPKRGIQMTGTVQFMAKEILDSVFQNKPIEHTESHDLESFAWVFAYVVFRRLLHDSDGEKQTNFSKEDRIAIQKSYEQSFGALKLDAVLTQREALKPFKIAETRINSLVPAAIAYLMRVLGVLVPQEWMTHDKLVYFIDKSVASLEEEMQYIVELTIVFDHDFHGGLEHWFADALPQFVNLRYLCIIDTGRSAVQKLLALGLPALLAGVPIEQFDACNLHFNADDLHLVLSIFSSTLRGLFLWECTSSSSNAAAIPSYSEGPPITSLPALRRLVLKPETKAAPRLPLNTLEVPRLSSLTCMYDEHFYDLSQWDSTSVSELTLHVNQNSNLPRFSPSLRPSSLTIIIFQTQGQWAYLPVIRWIGRLLSRFAHLDDLVDLKISIGNSDHCPTGVFYPSHSDCDELRSTLRCFLNGEKQRRILINLNISGPLKLVEPPADTGEVTRRRLRGVFDPLIKSGKLVLDVTIDEPIR